MDPRHPPAVDSLHGPLLWPILGALLGAALVAALWALAAAARRALRRRRGRRRQEHGSAGERRGRELLEAAGWRVEEAHPAANLTVAVDGEPYDQPLQADYLCSRAGRTLPAEVKTGQAADLSARATRRQLLEYAVAYRSGATLLVDADAGTVSEVRFPLDEPPPAPGRLRGLLAALLVGAALGLACGYWLFAAR